MMVRIHTKKPLETSVRSTFELPVWPYREGPGKTPIELLEYLRSLTVFRYEDNYSGGASGKYAYAILVPDEDGKWPHQWEVPFECYEHLLWIDDDTLEVLEWPNDNPQGFGLHRKIVEGTGDNYAWGHFNTKVQLTGCNSHVTVYAKGHNVPPNISNVREMKETSPDRAVRHVKQTNSQLQESQKRER